MKNFSDKVVAITGAGSGIGRALATKLADEGAELAISDVDQAGLGRTAALAAASPKVTTHVVDVSDRLAVEAYARDAQRQHGGVDVIINNAGVTSKATIEEASYEDLEWVIGINLWGVIYGVKAFLPLLKQRPEGHIVNISSVNAFIPFPAGGPYNISKYAVAGLSETLMQELRGTTVAVTCVHPGGIKTSIVDNARHMTDEESDLFARNARTTPERAAEIIVGGMKTGTQQLLVGFDASVMAAMKRLFPMRSVQLVGWLAGRHTK